MILFDSVSFCHIAPTSVNAFLTGVHFSRVVSRLMSYFSLISEAVVSLHMSVHKVKIAAHLHPRLPGELDDNSVCIYHASDNYAASFGIDSNAGRSFITMVNLQDSTQVFKFLLVSSLKSVLEVGY